MALDYGLKEDLGQKKSETQSARSEHEESVSMKDDYDTYSESGNEKLKRELELSSSDLHTLRKDFESLSQQNISLSQKLSDSEERISSLEAEIRSLSQEREELIIKERGNEKQIANLHKRIDAAKIEVLTLNSKIALLKSKL